MPSEFASFAFIITLAAVINGLGIVRWLNALPELLRGRSSIDLRRDWSYILAASFQFILHILLWWSLWGVRSAEALNFLSYLYLLSGPVLMFLGSAFLVPEASQDSLDLRDFYAAARPAYTTVLSLVWFWALFASPVFRGYFAATTPIFAVFLGISLVQRAARSESVQRVCIALNWLLLFAFVLGYGLELGGTVPQLRQ